ncbi:MAG: deoxyribonuclease IV [Candidatus Rokuibacteriota bacterium]|nr:MAG: deoxyribonuclease IV [Candidatus Rokubacteria bacterium]
MTLRGDEIGAHMSIAGGLHQALERGRAVGCGAVQIFLKNQRRWAAKPLEAEEIRLFRAARRHTGIRRVFAHSSYLINLASPHPSAWAQAVTAFTDELERAEALGLSCVVIHPGSHMGAGLEAGLRRVIAALDETLARTSGYRIKVALENTAGGGNSVGRTFAELATLIDGAARPERIGVCVDTCHLFAAGYDVRTEAGFGRAMTECESAVGRRRVLAFHLNDARAPLGSGLDRHEHIGRGFLGLAPFRFLLNDRRFARVPKVLETPKKPEPTADLRNLAILRRLRLRRRPGR